MKETVLEAPEGGPFPATRIAHERLQEVIDRALIGKPSPRVLEAGCGATSHVRIPDDTILTGIDISESQLDRNTSLDRKILGDIQTHDFGGEQFDLIICYNVLEHVGDPRRALENLLGACAPDGLLVIAVPNLWSIKGLVTKFTPFAIHRLFYTLMGDRRSGTAEFDQFPTIMKPSVAPRRLLGAANERGARTLFFHLYEGPVQEDLRSRLWLANSAFGLVGLLSRAITFGRYDLNHTDALLAFKPQER